MLAWSSDELTILERLWVSPALKGEIAAALPGRTWLAIKFKAQSLKLRRPGGRTVQSLAACEPRPFDKWTPDRVELLTYLFPTAPWRILSVAFPFSTAVGIERRARKAGLVRRAKRSQPAGRWTAENIAKLRAIYGHATEASLAETFPEFSRKALEIKASKLRVRRARRWDIPPSVVPEPGEIWRAVTDFRGLYWVSTHGRIAGHKGLSRVDMDRIGHPRVWLRRRGKTTSRGIAKVVLTAFAEAPGQPSFPAYRDGDSANVALANLHWLPRAGKREKAQAQKPAPLGEQHRYHLDQNAAWAAASRALKGTRLAPEDRDDVAADMVVAHLSGDLALDDFGARAAEFVRAYNRTFGRAGVVSLDQMVRGTEDLRLGDLISEDEYHERWDLLQGA